MKAILSLRRGLPIEAFAYILMAAGTLGDHLSTMVVLTRSYIYETNPFAILLMASGLWEAFDVVLIALGIVVPYLLIRRFRNPALRGLLAYPIVFGAVRLGACLWNLSLIV